jgi:hypothetical protein
MPRKLDFFNNVTANGTSQTVETKSGKYGGTNTVNVKASINGSGTVSGTVSFYGNDVRSNSGGVLLGSALSLTGSGSNTQGANVPKWPFMYAVLASITGTGATVSASVSE